MRRTLMRTNAAIFNSLRRIVAQVARANWVCLTQLPHFEFEHLL
jgi:hypothetical protein